MYISETSTSHTYDTLVLLEIQNLVTLITHGKCVTIVTLLQFLHMILKKLFLYLLIEYHVFQKLQKCYTLAINTHVARVTLGITVTLVKIVTIGNIVKPVNSITIF